MAKKGSADANAAEKAPPAPAPAAPASNQPSVDASPPATAAQPNPDPPPPPDPRFESPPELVEVAVLRDCWLGKVDDILSLPRAIAKAAAADGAVDMHPKAVEAIKVARAAARRAASVADIALED
ncbi:hypothetical protein [Pigmentiphaga daeguensis]|uniref:Uncharacterized protein n=1 Tax=Pigmentiphaga daeguensis TaxID=414049 RepID=A0ABP3L7D8_9BURK